MSKLQKIEKIEEFICKWQEQESLWNVNAVVYRDRDKKRKAIKELADIFEMTGKCYCISIIS